MITEHIGRDAVLQEFSEQLSVQAGRSFTALCQYDWSFQPSLGLESSIVALIGHQSWQVPGLMHCQAILQPKAIFWHGGRRDAVRSFQTRVLNSGWNFLELITWEALAFWQAFLCLISKFVSLSWCLFAVIHHPSCHAAQPSPEVHILSSSQVLLLYHCLALNQRHRHMMKPCLCVSQAEGRYEVSSEQFACSDAVLLWPICVETTAPRLTSTAGYLRNNYSSYPIDIWRRELGVSQDRRAACRLPKRDQDGDCLRWLKLALKHSFTQEMRLRWSTKNFLPLCAWSRRYVYLSVTFKLALRLLRDHATHWKHNLNAAEGAVEMHGCKLLNPGMFPH